MINIIKRIGLVLVLILMGCWYTSFAQKENYVWYFGNGAGLDFNAGSPIALTDGMSYVVEGTSSISDANGNLLFYTNGLKVWDKNHNVMPNGDSLKAGHSFVSTSTTQGALIIPYPGNSQLYYIFTLEDQFSQHSEFNYSLADITLNGGNGDIISKNNFVDSAMCEKLCAVRHANGSGIWVMVHGAGNNSFFCYLVTASGLSLTPVISNIGPVISQTNTDRIGCMKFSPNGAKIAYATHDSGYVGLFDFNAATGIVSNEKFLPLSGPTAYGIEFSTSSNYLYCSMELQRTIYQWDITSNNTAIINSTIQLIGSTNVVQEVGALQLGPDEKIYVAGISIVNPVHTLGVINSPEMPGALCNYQDTAVSLSIKESTLGLPNFIASYFLPTGINTNSPQQTQFTITPNPTTTTIQLTLNTKTNAPVDCEIWNVMGERVFEKKFETGNLKFETTLDVSFLEKGIYFIKVIADGKAMVQKVVKM